VHILVKLPDDVVAEDGIVAPRGRIWLNSRIALDPKLIYGVYRGPDGLYAVYTVRDDQALALFAPVVASRSAELTPIAVKIYSLKAYCRDKLAGEEDCTMARSLMAEVGVRELPHNLVTKENLRDELLRRFNLETALRYDTKVLSYVAPSVLTNVPLCDESGRAKIGGRVVYFCQIGDRLFVKTESGEPFYEVPKEWTPVNLNVIESRTHQGVGGLRRIFGDEADPDALIDYVARELGLAAYSEYTFESKYCKSPLVEWPSQRHFDRELYGGIVAVYRPYRLYSSDYECANAVSPYGVYVVVCTTLQKYKCRAWKIRGIGQEDPPDVIAECIYRCQCPQELLHQLDGRRKEEVLSVMETKLKERLEDFENFDGVKCFPLEAFSRVFGPITSYEEAKAKWEGALKEVEKREGKRRRLATNRIYR